MTRDASCTLTWGDGEYTFALPLGQIRELEEKRQVGASDILARILNGGWRVDDVRETIRLGLIGGGQKPAEATTLVARYVDGFPWGDSLMPAAQILNAALHGFSKDGDAPGKHEATAAAATDALTSPPSTGLEPS